MDKKKDIAVKFREDVSVALLAIANEYNLDYITEDEARKMADAITDSTVEDCIEHGQSAEDYADLLTY